MIASLSGTWHDGVIVVGGVGYKVAVIEEPANGTEVFVHTTCVMRENTWSLYGFATRDEQTVFEALLRVTRVGPQAAMSLLRHLGAAGVHAAVRTKDAAAVAKAPGIGKKTAETIVSFCELPDLDLPESPGESRVRELAEALDALGLPGSANGQLIADTVAARPDASEEELVRTLLGVLR